MAEPARPLTALQATILGLLESEPEDTARSAAELSRWASQRVTGPVLVTLLARRLIACVDTSAPPRYGITAAGREAERAYRWDEASR